MICAECTVDDVEYGRFITALWLQQILVMSGEKLKQDAGLSLTARSVPKRI